MSKKEATIIQNFNAEKRQYEYSVKGYDVTKSIEILLKKHKEEYDKERRVFESTKGYLEAQQEYEKHIANLQSQLDQANERLGKLEDILEKYGVESVEELDFRLAFKQNDVFNYKVVTELEQDRDTWKRACELASSHISWCPAKQGECNCAEEKRDCTNFFYQQAKKEGEQNE